MLHSIIPLYFITFSLFYVAFFIGGGGVGLIFAKLKNFILHELLCRHFAVRTEEYHDGPETEC